jgi:hypothetical protein
MRTLFHTCGALALFMAAIGAGCGMRTSIQAEADTVDDEDPMPEAGTPPLRPCGYGLPCDPTDIGGRTCESLGLARGVVSCDPDTCNLDISGCGGGAIDAGNPNPVGTGTPGTPGLFGGAGAPAPGTPGLFGGASDGGAFFGGGGATDGGFFGGTFGGGANDGGGFFGGNFGGGANDGGGFFGGNFGGGASDGGGFFGGNFGGDNEPPDAGDEDDGGVDEPPGGGGFFGGGGSGSGGFFGGGFFGGGFFGGGFFGGGGN